MGLQPRESSQLHSRTPAHRSSKNHPSSAGMAHSPPKSVPGARRLSLPSREEAAAASASTNSSASVSKLTGGEQKLTRLNRTTHNGGTAAATPRRPQRHSVGETAPRPASGSLQGASSPRRPTRHSFSMPTAPRIREEPDADEEDPEDEVDGFPTVFDTSRLANSPKPPRKFPVARPLRHSVCGGAAEAVAAAAVVTLRDSDLCADDAGVSGDGGGGSATSAAAAAAAAAERKRKRVRFSVPDIRLTEEQLEAFAAVAASASNAVIVEKERENQLAAPCSDIFRKAMLDMRFLSVEQHTGTTSETVVEETEADGSDTLSSSPSLET